MQRTHRIVCIIAIGAVVIALASCTTLSGNHMRGNAQLWRQGTSSIKLPRSPETIRSSQISIQSWLITAANNARLTITLPDAGQLTMVRISQEHVGKHAFVWHGTAEGYPGSSVTFSVVSRTVLGSIDLGRSFYRLRHYKGEQFVEEIDLSRIHYPREEPRSDTTTMMHPPLTAIGPDLHDATRRDGDMISTCSPNPADALKGEGGSEDALAARIAMAIGEANTSFANSNINLKFRLVYLSEVAYNEAHYTPDDRNNLQNGLIKDMNGVNVLTLRDQHDADIVVLLVEDGDGGPLGWSNQYDGNPDKAFSAVVRKYATSPLYVFTHELGHVMGANHSRNDTFENNKCSSPSTFPCPNDTGYNHGHIQASPSDPNVTPWGTIMITFEGCQQCRRKAYWSNPNVKYPDSNGDPTGVPIGSVDPLPEDNHYRINKTAASICSFRPRRFPVQPSQPSQEHVQ